MKPTIVVVGSLNMDFVVGVEHLPGSHPGFRPVHAKGIVCSGTFRGAPEARALCRALHFQGQAVPTTIRFANANGNPDVHDGLANVRSLAVKFQLPDGKNADILANSIEGFPVRTPEDFLEFLRAQTSGPGYRQACTRCGSPLPRQSPRHPRFP